jgi:hypothetical protein
MRLIALDNRRESLPRNIPVVNGNVIDGPPPPLATTKTGNLTLVRSVAVNQANWLTSSGSRFVQLGSPVQGVTDAGVVTSLGFNPAGGTNYSNKNVGSDSQVIGTTQIVYNNGLSYKTLTLPSGCVLASSWNNEVWAINSVKNSIYRSVDYGDTFKEVGYINDSTPLVNPAAGSALAFNFHVDSTHLFITNRSLTTAFVIDKSLTYARKTVFAGLGFLFTMGVYPNYSIGDNINLKYGVTQDGGLNWYLFTPSETTSASQYWDCHYSPPYFIMTNGGFIARLSVNGLNTFKLVTLSSSRTYDGVCIKGDLAAFASKSGGFLDIFQIT